MVSVRFWEKEGQNHMVLVVGWDTHRDVKYFQDVRGVDV